MLTLNDGRSELWQWDTGRTLSVSADCTQVHFSNKVFGRSIDVDVDDGSAIIPDVLLQTDKDLTAWAFVGTPENGYTKISKVFKVNKRNKPADYVFTPTDQTTLDEILDRIEDLENRPSGDISEEDIQNAVNDYLDKNPVSMVEKDPTVPAWAKQPNKPKYTAAEVDALPNTTVIPTVPTAEIGQTIVVKAVDENGKPTEWEAADFPTGGSGGRTPQLLRTVVLAEGEEVNAIEIDNCDDGTTFADAGWRKVGIKYITQGKSDLTAYETLFVAVNGIHVSYGYVKVKQGLYNTIRKGNFTLDAQGGCIVVFYNSTSGFNTATTTDSTHDVIDVPSTSVGDKITRIRIYHNTQPMLFGTKIEVWGIE